MRIAFGGYEHETNNFSSTPVTGAVMDQIMRRGADLASHHAGIRTMVAGVLDESAELGIDASHALCVPELPTSTYLYISRPDGDMALALSDMEVCSRITPEYLKTNLSMLQNARVVVADANLPAESLV